MDFIGLSFDPLDSSSPPYGASNFGTPFEMHYNCTLYTDSLGGNTDAVMRLVSICSDSCYASHDTTSAVWSDVWLVICNKKSELMLMRRATASV